MAPRHTRSNSYVKAVKAGITMRSQHSIPDPPQPLPQVPGPKLAPFTHNAHAEIKFIEELGSPDDLDSHVWKAEINGAVYALKMVSGYFALYAISRD